MPPADRTRSSAPIHVALAVDAGFAMPLAVTLASIAAAHPAGAVRATVLHDGLAADEIDRAEAGLAGRLDVRWLPADPGAVDGAHFSDFLTRASLFRMLLPRLLPWEERVIYLDSDIVVADSLAPLWEQDLGGVPLGAVRDAGAPFPVGPLGTDWRSLDLDPAAPYLNTGVMLMDLGAWRREELGERTIDLLRGARPIWGDQDGLNAVLGGGWLELARRWNLQSPDVRGVGLAWALWREDVERAIEDPAVIHFTERDKPWLYGCEHPLAEVWFEALDLTAWSGWRPRRPRDLHRRLARRVLA